MRAFVITTVVCFLIYLLLTTGSGSEIFGLWSILELAFGFLLSMIVGFIAKNVLVKHNYRLLNPVRWVLFLGYLIGPFFFSLAKANIDVAYRVITGRINPGIVRISPGLRTDLGITMLANSITLTPGTLSVDIDEDTNDLYIHWINVDRTALQQTPVDCSFVCGDFPKWVRRIVE